MIHSFDYWAGFVAGIASWNITRWIMRAIERRFPPSEEGPTP